MEELSEKGLVSFGPKMTRLDALGEDIERALEKGLDEIYNSKQERILNKELSGIKERHSSHKQLKTTNDFNRRHGVLFKAPS